MTCKDCKRHDECRYAAMYGDNGEDVEYDCDDFKQDRYCLEEDVMLLAKEPI